uniref:Uncharacterized protein n=1 Tax=Oryza meridionalis TaxID=40149 RepID=A0A0E0F077_9ORYZ
MGRPPDPVKPTWTATLDGEAGHRIGRPAASEAFRRTAASRSERLPPAAIEGQGEPIPRLGSGRRRATTARGGGQARRIGDVVARGKGQGGANLGLAETVRDRDAHAVTRDPMVTGDARAAALCGGSGDTARG